MSKKLATLVLLFVATASAQVSKNRRNQQNEPLCQTNITQNAVPLCVSTAQKSEIQPHAYAPEEKSKWWAQAFGPQTWPNWIVIVVAIWAGSVASKTFRIVRKQTVATEQSANASLRQAEHMVAAGRAWVLEEINFPLERVPYQPLEAGSNLMTTVVSVRLRNHGNSVARIRDIKLRFHQVREVQDRRMPAQPDYSQLPRHPELGEDGFMLAPRQKVNLLVKLETRCLSQQEAVEVENGGLGLWVYGMVEYETFDSLHVTQFCYLWHTPQGLVTSIDKAGFRRDGPPAYNRTT